MRQIVTGSIRMKEFNNQLRRVANLQKQGTYDIDNTTQIMLFHKLENARLTFFISSKVDKPGKPFEVVTEKVKATYSTLISK